MDFERKVLPFYMTCPGAYANRQDNLILRDMEYLHQTYPSEVRNYQRRVAEILDKMDYEGSMIYDEYPDRYSLIHTTKCIVGILQQDEKERGSKERTSPEKWEWTENLIQVLLCDEIYKRRHGGRRRFIKF